MWIYIHIRLLISLLLWLYAYLSSVENLRYSLFHPLQSRLKPLQGAALENMVWKVAIKKTDDENHIIKMWVSSVWRADRQTRRQCLCRALA